MNIEQSRKAVVGMSGPYVVFLLLSLFTGDLGFLIGASCLYLPCLVTVLVHRILTPAKQQVNVYGPDSVSRAD